MGMQEDIWRTIIKDKALWKKGGKLAGRVRGGSKREMLRAFREE